MVIRELAAKLGLEVDWNAYAKGDAAVELLKLGLEKAVEIAEALADTFKENIKEALEYGDATRKAAQASGVNAQALQELQHAADLADVSNEELRGGLMILTRTMRAAKEGAEEQDKALRKATSGYKDAHGKLRPVDEVLGEIADKFESMPDGPEKTALAMQLFGRSGARMIPMLNDGSAGLAEMRKEAEELGLDLIAKGLWRGAIAPLIPAIKELVQAFVDWRKANAEVMRQNLQAFIGTGVKVVNGLLKVLNAVTETIGLIKRQWKVLAVVLGGALGVALILKMVAAWQMFVAVLGLANIGMLTMARTAVVAALRFALSWAAAAAPFVAIAAGLAGIMLFLDDIEGYKAGKDSVFGRYKKAIDEWVDSGRKDDPWWLRAIKDLVVWMEKALGVADQLGLVANKAKGGPATGTAAGDVEVRRSNPLARWLGTQPTVTRDAAGSPQVQMGWADRLLGSQVIMGPALTPSVAAPGGGKTVNNTFRPELHFGAGTDKGTVDYAFDKWDEWYRGARARENEEAAAALPAVE